jgi:hypothetical protein
MRPLLNFENGIAQQVSLTYHEPEAVRRRSAMKQYL